MNVFTVNVLNNHTKESETYVFFDEKKAKFRFQKIADYYCYNIWKSMTRHDDVLEIAAAGSYLADYRITLKMQNLI